MVSAEAELSQGTNGEGVSGLELEDELDELCSLDELELSSLEELELCSLEELELSSLEVLELSSLDELELSSLDELEPCSLDELDELDGCLLLDDDEEPASSSLPQLTRHAPDIIKHAKSSDKSFFLIKFSLKL